jgi:pimeloyl-ACP methyl ester carboxylesterase
MLGRWIWARVEPLLAAPALAVDLPGRGARPADVTKLTLGDVVDSVVADIESWPVERVVLVAHSLSGILVPALISRLLRRVVRAVFVGAAVPEPGSSYLDSLPRSERLFLRIVLLTQRKGLLTPGSAARRALCNDLDEPTTRLVLQGLTREAPGLYGAPVPGGMPASTPTLYVKLSADHGFSPALQTPDDRPSARPTPRGNRCWSPADARAPRSPRRNPQLGDRSHPRCRLRSVPASQARRGSLASAHDDNNL